MYETQIADIRRYNELKNITDEEIVPYIEMAEDELSKMIIPPDKKTKIISYMTLKLLGQKLWHRIQQRANEYDETLETFKDVNRWEEYWQERINALLASTSNSSMTNFGFGAV